MNTWGRKILPLCACALLAGCFFYDSRWGQAKKAQRRAANDYTATQLGSEQDTSRLPARVEYRLVLHVYASGAHMAQVVDWQARFRRSVEEANRILQSVLNLQLEVSQMAAFDYDGDDLEQALDVIEQQHPSTDGAVVVGLIGSLSRLEMQIHQLGVARHGGTHLVMRAANDALEYDAIRNNLTKLSEEERAHLYASRQQHKAAAVLVHELGHVLGAEHSVDNEDLMNPVYSHVRTRLGPNTTKVMREGITARLTPPSVTASNTASASPPPVATATGLGVWAPGVATGQSPQLQPSGESRAASSDLSDEERAQLQALIAERNAGRAQDAWRMGQTLFQVRGDNPAVVELRCQLAMDLQLPWQEVKQYCSSLTLE